MKIAIHHPGKSVAVSAAVAVALIALLPGAWGAALAQTAGTPAPETEETPVTTTVAAGEPATIQAQPDMVIRIPAGAIKEDATVSVVPIFDADSGEELGSAEVFAQLQVPAPGEVASGDALVVELFTLEAVDENGNEIIFDEPVAVDFELTPEVIAEAGGDLNNVALQFFDEATNQWTPVECSGADTTVTCLLPHFSTWTLVVRTQTSEQAPAPADTGMGLADETSATNTALLLAGIVAVAAGAGVGARLMVRRRP